MPKQRNEPKEDAGRNERCFLWRWFRFRPFERCRFCRLAGAHRCPTIIAGLGAVLLAAAAAVAARLIGGGVGRTVFIAAGMIAVVLLLIINSYSNTWAKSRLQLNRLHQEIRKQQDFLKELSPLQSLQGCAEHIVQSAATRLRCRRVSLMLPDENQEYLHIAAACGLPEDIVRDTRMPIGEGVSGHVFQMNAPIHVSDARKCSLPSELAVDSFAYMSAPLLLSGMRWGAARVGVLSVTEPVARDDFTLEDEFVFSNICEAAAVALYNHMAIAKVKTGNVEILETLISALEARDNYTRGHSERVSEISLAIGRRLSLSSDSLEQLRVSARLHDIGKIGIPDAVLLKEGPLTDEERGLIRQHTDIGVRILSQASFLPGTMAAIREHHERLDGQGYYGLIRREIPIVARIIAVADAFDAMTSARPYRRPMPVAKALAEVKRCRGQQFDEACADALVRAVEAGDLGEPVEAETNPAAAS
jgi:GAF domain-containing protein